jgi:hypothetical protein
MKALSELRIPTDEVARRKANIETEEAAPSE